VPGVPVNESGRPANRERLSFRARPSLGESGGQHRPFGVGTGRDGILYVPDTAERRAPMMVFLHGAGGSGQRELRLILAAADRYGVVVAAPDSRGTSWDVMSGAMGPDVAFIDQVLDAVADGCDVDTAMASVGGVSDGASYALCVGLANGDVFDSVIAFSPGFAGAAELVGRPRLFVSHGTADPILPIDTCSRRLVPALRDLGYDVTYQEFDGGHTVPPEIADEAVRWWLSPGGQA